MEYYKKNEEAVDFGFTPDADFPAIYGENAISKLMNELSGVVTDCKLIEFFHEFIKLEYNGESLGGQVSDEASGPASYNIGKIETVGDDIVLYIDLHYPVTFNLEDIVNAINSHLSENGFSDVKVEVITNLYLSSPSIIAPYV